MSDQFKYLFSQLKIGKKMVVKNRIVVTCHYTNFHFEHDDNNGETYIEYLRARARGGVGLIIGGVILIDKSTIGYGIYPPNHDILREKLGRLAEAVHEHGGKLLMQVAHHGRDTMSTESLRPLKAFSALPSPDFFEMPHEMSLEEVDDIIDKWVAYCVDCREAGADGVELHGAHGYLLQQSWSRWCNRRKDKYGEQMGFANELIDRVRDAVGEDFVICVRIALDDLVPGGLNNEAMQEIAIKLEETNKVDMINTSVGGLISGYAYAIGTMYVPLGAFVPYVGKIRERLKKVPIVAVGRIKDPIQAEKVLADGHSDLVAMTRQHICDPETANKAMEGRLDDIRKCVSLNEGCIERIFDKLPLSCVQNAAVGKEKELGILPDCEKKKKIMVIGGGPAGMEFARVASLRGHEIVLVEKEGELGGQVNLIIKDPSRNELQDVTRYLVTQINKAGIEVRTGVEADEDMILNEHPDAVVISTGSVPRALTFPVSEDLIPGWDEKIVTDIFSVYSDPASVGNKVLLLDRTGKHQGLTTALFLAAMGKEVEVVTPMFFAGMFAGYTYLPVLYQHLYKFKTVFTTSSEIKEVSGNKVVLYNVFSQAETTREGVDTLVPVVPQTAVDTLYGGLKSKIGEIHLIGDAAAPRNIMQAIHDGFNLGWKI